LRFVDRAEVVRKELDGARSEGRTIGLVPTMGALHEGHASLIRRAAAECDVAVVTIFVNPLQFDDPADLAAYPRAADADLAAAAGAGADLVFAPSAEEMYPDGPPCTEVRVRGTADGLEGASRTGHFAGVTTVVAKLFNFAGPCRAYFGEKDFQQLAVVRRMVADLSFPVDVVGCPTVREPDGLALSSRNARLGQEDRRAAVVVSTALRTGAAMVAGGVTDASLVRARMVEVVRAEAQATLDYAEVADPATLDPLDVILGTVRLLVAARIGPVRLIDNMEAPTGARPGPRAPTGVPVGIVGETRA